MKHAVIAIAFSTALLSVAAADAPPAAPTVAAPAAKSAAITAPAGATAAKAAPAVAFPAVVTELIVRDDKIGEGKIAQQGRAALVHYTGWLYDPGKPNGRGLEFDSSKGQAVPFIFLIGVGKVIAGWDQGVVGMKVNGRRTLIVPPGLAYGDKGALGKIPPNATLIFEIEMISVIGGPASESNPIPTSPP
jgi:FKBP-type peptidyl-prolyl cis-trans isomerase FkpA